MNRRLKVGIVGCGAIGSSLARAVLKDFFAMAEVAALYDRDEAKSRSLAKSLSRKKHLAVGTLKQLIKKSDLVLECSSSLASFGIAQETLRQGRAIMIMSVGGVAGKARALAQLAQRYGGKVYIPSGAVSGIDALKAARAGRIDKITLVTRKNPVSFKGVAYVQKKGIALERLKKDVVLFNGSAREAVRFFPQNINVAGLLSMAGIGPDRTRVKIIASPATQRNIHEIEVQGPSGRILTRTENVLHPDNPKTSYLAVLSALAVLKQILDPVRIGT